MRAGILFEEPSPSGSRPSVGFIKDLSTCSNAQLPPRLHIFGMCVVSHVGVDVQHPAVLSTQSTLSYHHCVCIAGARGPNKPHRGRDIESRVVTSQAVSSLFTYMRTTFAFNRGWTTARPAMSPSMLVLARQTLSRSRLLVLSPARFFCPMRTECTPTACNIAMVSGQASACHVGADSQACGTDSR